jgi:DNA-binding IclR family transcriptional regulator
MAGDWTFLTNHAHVLVFLSTHPDARVRDLAEAVGVTERSVMAILGDLEEGGYVTRTRVGRRNEYRIDPQLTFRHPAEASQPVGKLLAIFSGRD